MDNLINTSKIIALLSFVIGTILFALQLYFKQSDAFISPGLIFVIIALIINSISLLALTFSLLGSTKRKIEILQTCGIVLLNIPIAILYFYILILTEFRV